MKLAADDRVVARVPGLGRVRAAARHRAGPGHPLRRGRGAAGRPQRGRDPRHPAQGAATAWSAACAVAHEEIVVIATAAGYAKRTAVDEFPVQARGGAGVKAAKVDKARGGALAGVAPAAETVAFLTADGAVAVPSASVRGRGTRRRRLQGRRRRRRGAARRRRSRRRRPNDRLSRLQSAGFSIVFQSRVRRRCGSARRRARGRRSSSGGAARTGAGSAASPRTRSQSATASSPVGAGTTTGP